MTMPSVLVPPRSMPMRSMGLFQAGLSQTLNPAVVEFVGDALQTFAPPVEFGRHRLRVLDGGTQRCEIIRAQARPLAHPVAGHLDVALEERGLAVTNALLCDA